MTQYVSEIAGYPIADGLPANWTGLRGDYDHIKVEADVTAPPFDRVLSIGEFSNYPTTASWTTFGTQTNQEALCLVKFSGSPTSGSNYATCAIRWKFYSFFFWGYYCGYKCVFHYGDQVRLVKQTSSGDSTLGSASFSWAADGWYWVRLRANGSTITLKVWARGNAEPGSWSVTATDTAYGDGKAAVIFDSNALKPHYVLFAAASAGDTAPGVGLSISALANLAPTAHLQAGTTQKWVDNLALLELRGDIYARTAWPWISTALLAASSDLNSGISFSLYKWSTWTGFAGRLTLSVDAHVVHRHVYQYPGDRYQRRHVADYAEALSDLLPQGLAWPRESTSVLQRAVTGLAGMWGTEVEDAVELLLTKEADPRTTTVLLDDWERAWGLPDPCLTPPVTVNDRQAALLDKYTLKGGQSRAFFIDRAARLGYQISITEYAPFMAGVSEAGDTRDLDVHGNYRWEIGMAEMRFCWTVKVESHRFIWFRAGWGQAGVDHHLELGFATDLECLIRRWKPAHTFCIFDYTPLTAIDLSQQYNTCWLMVLAMM